MVSCPCRSPIRLVLFDAFGTLVQFHPPGIGAHYGKLARSYGLIVDDEDIVSSFRPAFKHFQRLLPLYGKHSSPPLDPDRWWTLVIEKTLQDAGVADSDLQTTLPLLGPALFEHFSSRAAYALTRQAVDTLEALRRSQQPPVIGVLTNSDNRMLSVLESLKATPDYIRPEHVYTSWDLGYAKPDRRAFLQAIERIGGGNIEASEVLHVGDDAKEDFEAARSLGMQAILVDGQQNMLEPVLEAIRSAQT